MAVIEEIEYHGAPATRVRYPNGMVGVYVMGCPYCKRERDSGSWFFPSHYASDRCESGKHNHCTCDTCF